MAFGGILVGLAFDMPLSGLVASIPAATLLGVASLWAPKTVGFSEIGVLTFGAVLNLRAHARADIDPLLVAMAAVLTAGLGLAVSGRWDRRQVAVAALLAYLASAFTYEAAAWLGLG
jgi:hypothetical protein